MAVDTANKRYSMIQFARMSTHMLPIPDGTIGVQDRAMYEHLYHGIALDSLTPPVPSTSRGSGAKKGHRLGSTNRPRGTSLG